MPRQRAGGAKNEAHALLKHFSVPMHRPLAPELPAEVLEHIFRLGPPDSEPWEPSLSAADRVRPRDGCPDACKPRSDCPSAAAGSAARRPLRPSARPQLVSSLARASTYCLQVRCQLVCKAWQHALDPRRWPLLRMALRADAPDEAPAAASWLQRVGPAVRHLQVELGFALPKGIPYHDPDQVAAHLPAELQADPAVLAAIAEQCAGSPSVLDIPAVQAVRGALLAMQPQGVSKGRCLGAGVRIACSRPVHEKRRQQQRLCTLHRAAFEPRLLLSLAAAGAAGAQPDRAVPRAGARSPGSGRLHRPAAAGAAEVSTPCRRRQRCL